MKCFASRQVCNAIQARNGPNVTDLLSASIGLYALVCCIVRNRWEEQFIVLDIERDDIHLLFSIGPSKFRSTAVRSHITPMDNVARTNIDNLVH